MPYVKQQLEPGKAFETIYCSDPPDPSDPFEVKREFQIGISRSRDFKPKKVPNDLRRRPWYCPMDCDEARNGCTQYEWARYKLDPRPHNKEFRVWLEEQRERKSSEPEDYDQLYERFLKCFEQKPSPDPLCKVYEECCKPKKSRKEDNQGGGDGHGGIGDGQQPGRPGESPPDQGIPNDGDKPGTGKEKEDNEKGNNEGADDTSDNKDKGDGNDKNKVVEKDKQKNKFINEDKDKDNVKERVVKKKKNKDINKDKDKDKDISKDQDDDDFKNIHKHKNENKNKNKNKNRHKNKNKNKNKNEEKINEESKIEKRKPESDVIKKEIPKRDIPIPNEPLFEKGRPSVIPFIPSEKNSDRPSKVEPALSNTELETPVVDYDKFVPVIPKYTIKVPPKKKKKVRNKEGDKNEKIEKIKKICPPCPPQFRWLC